MSFHVYIARPGFKHSPLTREQWLAAAQGRPQLKVLGGPGSVCFALVGDSAQRLALDPHGLVHTQNPSRALVDVMFELAGVLEAGVYSEKLKRYSSPEDWEERTRSHRAQYQRQRALQRRERRKRQLMGLAVVAAIVALCALLPAWRP